MKQALNSQRPLLHWGSQVVASWRVNAQKRRIDAYVLKLE